jgi:serine/threonine-protein kinase
MGAFGEVYLARDPELERDVAVKALRSDAISRDSMDILLREARAVASLQHPALVTVYDVGSDDATTGWSWSTSPAKRCAIA